MSKAISEMAHETLYLANEASATSETNELTSHREQRRRAHSDRG
jgi:hypothetical protein